MRSARVHRTIRPRLLQEQITDLVSLAHAFLVISAGLLALISSSQSCARSLMSISILYFVWDSVALLWRKNQYSSGLVLSFILHHVICLYVLIPAVVFNKDVMTLLLAMVLAELPNPLRLLPIVFPSSTRFFLSWWGSDLRKRTGGPQFWVMFIATRFICTILYAKVILPRALLFSTKSGSTALLIFSILAFLSVSLCPGVLHQQATSSPSLPF
jgi:hypothetical protein